MDENAAIGLVDASERARFASELDTNFSVVAPAGVGKTTAIVDRIVGLALRDRHREDLILPRLLVVTYTKAAAAEMQDRTRLRLLEHPELMPLFSRAFFGTIHSLCLHLMERYGLFLGLSGQLKLDAAREARWMRFLRKQQLFSLLPESHQRFFQYVPLSKLLSLTPQMRAVEPEKLDQEPEVDFTAILQFVPDKRNAAKVEEGKGVVKRWLLARETGDVAGVPLFKQGGGAFQELWRSVWAPWQAWLESVSTHLLRKLSRAFFEQSLQEGLIGYDDMVFLALELFKTPAVAERIARERFCVLLDEAQDTDTQQFELLLKLADDAGQPGPGRFSMVGDPQQSIYERADLQDYLALSARLAQSGSLTPLTFSVTMRCEQAIVRAVNALFPSILSPSDATPSQVNFVPLHAKPNADPGQCVRLDLEGDPCDHIADIAQTLIAGVERPSDIVFLAPRRRQLAALKSVFDKKGLRCQLHSSDRVLGDLPLIRWMAGLSVVAADPGNAFEVAGVLAEIFGLSDAAIAEYVLTRPGEVHPLSLLSECGNGDVGDTLRALKKLFDDTQDWPLREQAEEWMEGLVERLTGTDRLENLKEAREWLLLAATQCEAIGSTRSDWAEFLKCQLNEPLSANEVDDTALQLFTYHKSKGLEWKVVCLPFLFQPLYPPVEGYPRLQKNAVVFSAPEDTSDVEAFGRLLYVALTRARSRLVFLNDAACWEKRARLSPGEHLQLQASQFWGSIDRSITPLAVPKQPPSLPVEEQVDLQRASSLFRNRPYRERTLPSLLSEKVVHFERPTESLGSEYGQWWHSTLAQAPWGTKDVAVIVSFLQKATEKAPHAEVALADVERLIASPLFVDIVRASLVRTEVPFVWGKSDTEAVEGSVDLLYLSQNGQWTVVDWKTERLPLAVLEKHYAPQLQAYQNALSALLGQSVESVLYGVSCN